MMLTTGDDDSQSFQGETEEREEETPKTDVMCECCNHWRQRGCMIAMSKKHAWNEMKAMHEQGQPRGESNKRSGMRKGVMRSRPTIVRSNRVGTICDVYNNDS